MSFLKHNNSCDKLRIATLCYDLLLQWMYHCETKLSNMFKRSDMYIVQSVIKIFHSIVGNYSCIGPHLPGFLQDFFFAISLSLSEEV